MDDTAAQPTHPNFKPAGLLAGTAAAIIVAAMLLPSAGAAFGTVSASPSAASGGSVSGSAAPGGAPTTVPASVTGFGIPASGAGAELSGMTTGNAVVAIAGSMDSTTFLTTGGKIFQASSDGVTNMRKKSGAYAPTAIAAGAYFAAALNGDGTVAVWGENSAGQANVPDQLIGAAAGPHAMAIAAGFTHMLALLTDGTVLAWGGNIQGQANVPAGLAGVTAIAAGGDVSGAVVAGHVVTWGAGVGAQPAGMASEKIVSLAAGDRSFLALASDGRVFAWGADYTPASVLPPAVSALTDVVQIASGNSHGLVLTKTGKVYAFGIAGFGVTDVPAGLPPVRLIGAGEVSSWAVSGTVIAGVDESVSALATLPAVQSAVEDWAVADAAGNSAAQALVQNTAAGQGPPPGETVTSVLIHGDTAVAGAAGMICLKADITGTSPTQLGGPSSSPWEIAVDVGNPARPTVISARIYPTGSGPCG